jgi:hypothetical protein
MSASRANGDKSDSFTVADEDTKKTTGDGLAAEATHQREGSGSLLRISVAGAIAGVTAASVTYAAGSAATSVAASSAGTGVELAGRIATAGATFAAGPVAGFAVNAGFAAAAHSTRASITTTGTIAAGATAALVGAGTAVAVTAGGHVAAASATVAYTAATAVARRVGDAYVAIRDRQDGLGDAAAWGGLRGEELLQHMVLVDVPDEDGISETSSGKPAASGGVSISDGDTLSGRKVGAESDAGDLEAVPRAFGDSGNSELSRLLRGRDTVSSGEATAKSGTCSDFGATTTYDRHSGSSAGAIDNLGSAVSAERSRSRAPDRGGGATDDALEGGVASAAADVESGASVMFHSVLAPVGLQDRLDAAWAQRGKACRRATGAALDGMADRSVGSDSEGEAAASMFFSVAPSASSSVLPSSLAQAAAMDGAPHGSASSEGVDAEGARDMSRLVPTAHGTDALAAALPLGLGVESADAPRTNGGHSASAKGAVSSSPSTAGAESVRSSGSVVSTASQRRGSASSAHEPWVLVPRPPLQTGRVASAGPGTPAAPGLTAASRPGDASVSSSSSSATATVSSHGAPHTTK